MLTSPRVFLFIQDAAKEDINIGGRESSCLENITWRCQLKQGRIQAQKSVNGAPLQSGVIPAFTTDDHVPQLLYVQDNLYMLRATVGSYATQEGQFYAATYECTATRKALHVWICFADDADTSSEDWSPVSTLRGLVKHTDVPQRLSGSGIHASKNKKQLRAAPTPREATALHSNTKHNGGSQLQQKTMGTGRVAVLPTRDEAITYKMQPAPEGGNREGLHSGCVGHGDAQLTDARLQEDLQSKSDSRQDLILQEVLIR